MVVLLSWVCSRCCECSALFSSSLELWGARDHSTAGVGTGHHVEGMKSSRDVVFCVELNPGPLFSLCSASALFA